MKVETVPFQVLGFDPSIENQMEETGTVVEIRNRVALVSTEAKEVCHSCSARRVCHLGGQKTMVAEVWNPLGAQVGDEVRIHLSSQSVVGAAFLLYMVPLLFFFGGLILGQTLTHSQAWAVVLGFLFMGGSYAGLRILDRRLSGAEKFRPEIVEIVAKAVPKRLQGEAGHKG